MILSVAAPKSAMAATAGLECKPSNLWFKQVTVGTEKNFNASVTNIGSSNITVSQVRVQGAGFRVGAANLPWTLAPGQKVWFQVSFAPQTAGHVDGTIGFTSSASTSEQYLLNVHGTAVAGNVLNPYPVGISFGNVSVGTTSQRTEVLTNSGTSNINISQTNVAGSGFRVSGLSTPLTLAAGQKVSFIVSFIPQLTGITSGALSVISDAADSTLTVALSATGVSAGALTPAAASISYGSVQVGNSISRPATLTNSGTSDVTISQASVSGAGFSISVGSTGHTDARAELHVPNGICSERGGQCEWRNYRGIECVKYDSRYFTIGHSDRKRPFDAQSREPKFRQRGRRPEQEHERDAGCVRFECDAIFGYGEQPGVHHGRSVLPLHDRSRAKRASEYHVQTSEQRLSFRQRFVQQRCIYYANDGNSAGNRHGCSPASC